MAIIGYSCSSDKMPFKNKAHMTPLGSASSGMSRHVSKNLWRLPRPVLIVLSSFCGVFLGSQARYSLRRSSEAKLNSLGNGTKFVLSPLAPPLISFGCQFLAKSLIPMEGMFISSSTDTSLVALSILSSKRKIDAAMSVLLADAPATEDESNAVSHVRVLYAQTLVSAGMVGSSRILSK